VSKKSPWVGSESTRVRGGSTSYLLRVKSKLGSGQGPSLQTINGWSEPHKIWPDPGLTHVKGGSGQGPSLLRIEHIFIISTPKCLQEKEKVLNILSSKLPFFSHFNLRNLLTGIFTISTFFLINSSTRNSNEIWRENGSLQSVIRMRLCDTQEEFIVLVRRSRCHALKRFKFETVFSSLLTIEWLRIEKQSELKIVDYFRKSQHIFIALAKKRLGNHFTLAMNRK